MIGAGTPRRNPNRNPEAVLTGSPKLQGDMPPEGFREQRAAPAPARRLIAMTRDAALIHALQDLAGDELTILLVEDLRHLADELLQNGSAVALLDSQALGVPADAAVDALKNQFPDVRLMVAGQAAEQNMLATRISDQRVFRFIHKPASPQRLRLFLEAAASISPARRADAAAAADTQTVAAASVPTRGGGSLLPVIAGIAAVLILGIGGWMVMNRDDTAQASGAGFRAPRAAESPQVREQLQRAQQAESEGRLVAADGSSAAELYREALRLDAGSTAAAEGFERSIENALAGAERALLDGKLDDARVTAEMSRLIVPENSRLAFLYAQIEREMARINTDATQRQALEARRAQIREAVDKVTAHIESGALVYPLADSAVSRFREAQAIGGGDPLVRGSRDALVAALLTAADQELEAGRPAIARDMVEAAGSVNSSAPGLDIMRRRLEEATRKAAVVEPAPMVVPTPAPPPAPSVVESAPQPEPAAIAPAPPAPAPTPAATPAAGPDGSGVISALTLKVLRKVEPDYPPLALERLQSGWVEMEFTITKEGSVKDVTVVESQPGRTFDSAATSAMRRWRFEPVLRNGQPVEQRASMRMRFAAQDR